MSDDVEVVGTPSRFINGVWEPVDEYGTVISNRQPKQQKMSKRVAKPWTKTQEVSVNAEQVYAKTGKGKNGPTLIMGVRGPDGKIKRVSAKYVYTGMHPERKAYTSRRRSGAGSRAYHLGGGTRKEWSLARKKFMAAESPAQRRTDRKTTETLVYNAADYNPLVNDFPGIDEAGYSKRAKWNAKAGDYIVGKGRGKIDPNSYQGQVMAWNRARRMAKKYGLPEPSKPQRVGPAPVGYIRKADRVAVAVPAAIKAEMMVDAPSRKRRNDDDDNDSYNPELFRLMKAGKRTY